MHAFQGCTGDTVIVAMKANHPNRTTQKTFYVEISRARHHAELVTDDRGAFRGAPGGGHRRADRGVGGSRARARESEGVRVSYGIDSSGFVH